MRRSFNVQFLNISSMSCLGFDQCSCNAQCSPSPHKSLSHNAHIIIQVIHGFKNGIKGLFHQQVLQKQSHLFCPRVELINPDLLMFVIMRVKYLYGILSVSESSFAVCCSSSWRLICVKMRKAYSDVVLSFIIVLHVIMTFTV